MSKWETLRTVLKYDYEIMKESPAQISPADLIKIYIGMMDEIDEEEIKSYEDLVDRPERDRVTNKP